MQKAIHNEETKNIGFGITKNLKKIEPPKKTKHTTIICQFYHPKSSYIPSKISIQSKTITLDLVIDTKDTNVHSIETISKIQDHKIIYDENRKDDFDNNVDDNELFIVEDDEIVKSVVKRSKIH